MLEIARTSAYSWNPVINNELRTRWGWPKPHTLPQVDAEAQVHMAWHCQRAASNLVMPGRESGHDRAGQDGAGQGRAGQGRAGQGRAGPGRAGQGPCCDGPTSQWLLVS